MSLRMSPRVAIIAGSGRFPFHIAREAKRQGFEVVALGIQGWADASLASHVDAYEELGIGQLRQWIERLKAHGIREAIMAGKVTKAVLLDGRTAFDADAQALIGRLGDFSVSALLGAIGQRLAAEGIQLLDSSTFLSASLCPPGPLTVRRPSAAEEDDVRLGLQVARQLATLDVGQTVVVKGRVVIAVEALEGTDAAIQRAHALVGSGLVVVKSAAVNQDRRFDLPVIGPKTLQILRECGASCLAVEAGATLLLDRDALIASANDAGLCLVGVAA